MQCAFTVYHIQNFRSELWNDILNLTDPALVGYKIGVFYDGSSYGAGYIGQLAQQFYNIYHRLPVRSDIYKGWNIGTYVHGLKNGSNGHMKKAIEDIFEQEIDFNYKVFKMNDDEIFDMCKKFYEEFKRLPEVNESYKGWRIGLFIQEIRDGKHQLIKNIVSDIFENLI